ncbi:MAG: ATP-binding protein [Terricaulis sp.]
MTDGSDTEIIEVLQRVGAAVASELDLDRAVQMVTDAATELSGAAFGAFFHNVTNADGKSYVLYTLSGVPKDAFAKFPMPRNTPIFAPTFNGEGIVRSDDILADPRYGKMDTYGGMPKGHLPVRSYLAVPVVSRSGEVLGGLFLGHPETHRFDQRVETIIAGIAVHAAIAIDNARLYQSAQREIERRKAAEAELRRLNETLEERARARNKELEAANEQFRILVQGVVDYAIYMLTPEGNVSTWNAGAQRIKGYSAAEVVGRHFSMFYTPEARAGGEPARAIAEARDKGRVEMEGWRLRKDGSRFWASVIIDAVRNDEGAIIGFAKVTRDITEKREAQQQLDQTRDALFQAQKMESVGQLTGGIAHDFNNVLAGIIGALNLLQRRIKAKRFDETEKYISAALDAANRAAALTSRLLAFGRRQSLDIQPINVASAVQAVRAMLGSAIGENIAVEINIADEKLIAMADQHQLESAILNLALNSRDAMPSGGKITIATGTAHVDAERHSELKPGDYVTVSVADVGAGMPADVIERAFEPFFTTKPSGAGTGLGLSMVYGFAKQAGGNVTIDSVEGLGTTITVYLPQAPEAAVDEAPAEKLEAPEGQGEIVLVVEDDRHVRMLVMDVLEELGYQAKEATDANGALPYLESGQRLDLLISDVGLPGLNGRQLADIARHHRPELKVLFLTGYAAHAAVRSEFLAQGMDLMTKPFDLDALAARIKDMLARAPAHA